MNMPLRWALLLPLLAPPASLADTLNLPPVADTYIVSAAPDNNVGGETYFDSGTDGFGGIRRGLLRFDLSSLPSGVTITSAVVQLTVVKVPSGGGVDSVVDLFRLTGAWGEGTNVSPVGSSKGAPAASGEATWNAREQNVANWTVPGATSDAAGTASASTPVSSLGLYSWSGQGLVNDLRYWQTNSAQNFGWLVRSESEGTFHTARGFGAREGSAGGTLQVGYSPAANRPGSLTIRRLGGNVVLDWAGSYPLQSSPNLVSGYGDIGVTNGPCTNAIGSQPKFFRLRSN